MEFICGMDFPPICFNIKGNKMVVIIASDAHGRLHEDDEFIIDIYTRYIYIYKFIIIIIIGPCRIKGIFDASLTWKSCSNIKPELILQLYLHPSY